MPHNEEILVNIKYIHESLWKINFVELLLVLAVTSFLRLLFQEIACLFLDRASAEGDIVSSFTKPRMCTFFFFFFFFTKPCF